MFLSLGPTFDARIFQIIEPSATLLKFASFIFESCFELYYIHELNLAFVEYE